MFQKNQGVTLVELLVGIAIGSLVTMAATTLILMGLRLNRQSMDVSSRQNTARVLLNSLEDLASEGSISAYVIDDANGNWWVYGEEGEPEAIYSYNKDANTIYNRGSVFMKDILASKLEYEKENGLLTIAVETEEGTFKSTTFCRMAISSSVGS